MINVKDVGIIGDGITDFTDQINELFIQNSGETIFFPNGIYLINTDEMGIKPRSGTTILLSAGTVLKALPATIKNYSILNIAEVEDVSASGGSIVGERERHLGLKNGYYGGGIKIWLSRNTHIHDMAISQVCGDGIFVGSNGPAGEITGPTTIERVISYGNVRAGLSVTYVTGLYVRDSSFLGSYGAFSEGLQRIYSGGISIEPDPIDGISADDLVFERIICAHNEAWGMRATGYHRPVNGLRINELHSHHNGTNGLGLHNEINNLSLGKLDIHDNTEEDILFADLNATFAP